MSEAQSEANVAQRPEGYVPRSKALYDEKVRAGLREKFQYKNVMQVPKGREDCYQHGYRRSSQRPQKGRERR